MANLPRENILVDWSQTISSRQELIIKRMSEFCDIPFDNVKGLITPKDFWEIALPIANGADSSDRCFARTSGGKRCRRKVVNGVGFLCEKDLNRLLHNKKLVNGIINYKYVLEKKIAQPPRPCKF
jgi:hypothetical protein